MGIAKKFDMIDTSSVHVPRVDIEIRKLTATRVRNQVKQFVRILDRNSSEEKVHEFLAAHSYFFFRAIDLYGPSPLFSKIKFGSEYVADFAWFQVDSLGIEWNLVEIEPPTEPLFTAKGDPSSSFNHALEQIRNWNRWILTNGAYARRLLPNVLYPLGHLFMGRRKDLTQRYREKLRHLSHENRATLRIHTLDWFVTSGLEIADYISRGNTSWTLPVKALTHKDLAKGLKGYAKESLESSYQKKATPVYLQHRLIRRETGYDVE